MIGQCPCKRQIAQTHLVGLLGCASVTGIVVRLSRLHCGLLPPTETRLLRPLAVLDCCLLLCCHSSTENRLPRLQRFIRPEKAMSKRQEELWIPASCEARLTHIPHPSRLARSRFPTRASRSAAASLCSFPYCLASFWHTGWVPSAPLARPRASMTRRVHSGWCVLLEQRISRPRWWPTGRAIQRTAFQASRWAL